MGLVPNPKFLRINIMSPKFLKWSDNHIQRVVLGYFLTCFLAYPVKVGQACISQSKFKATDPILKPYLDLKILSKFERCKKEVLKFHSTIKIFG